MIRRQFTETRSSRPVPATVLLFLVLAFVLVACASPPGQEDTPVTPPTIPTTDSGGETTPVASPTLSGEPEENATQTSTAAAETPGARPSTTSKPGTATPTATELEETATDDATVPENNLQPIDSRETAFSVLASYYDAINRQDYERAYGYLRDPQQSYESFASGFAETASVSVAVHTPHYGGAAAGSHWAAMPVVLMAIHEDGSRHNFAGCAVAWSASEGVAETPRTEWALDRFTIEESTSTDSAVMDTLCADEVDLVTRPFDLAAGPVLLIGSYYNAIDLGEFQRAYDYWQAPAQSFEEFEQGFQNLDTVTAIAGLPYRREAAAGSLYAEVPVLLIATNTDGSQESYAGCFVAQGTNLGPEEAELGWSLRDANLQAVTSTDLSQLATLCTG